jgi:hypothetical protein
LDFLGLTHLNLLVNVYLFVDFLLLIIGIMQTLLNTHSFALYPPLQRMLLNTKAGLLSVLTLLLVVGAVSQAQAQAFRNDFVYINGTKYATNNSTTTRLPNSLGSFDRNSNSLLLGGEANTTTSGNTTVQSVQLLYRVYQSGTQVTATSPAFVPLSLTKGGTSGNGNNTITQWINTNSQPNLLAGTTVAGPYVLEFLFQGNGIDNKNVVTPFFENNNGSNYITTFNVTITPSAPPVATWNGSVNNDWYTASNWSTGTIPNASTDVTIPYVLGRRAPIVGANPTPAQVRTLTIEGRDAANNANLIIQGGELQVFGDFIDPTGGLSESVNGVFTLAGSTPQTIHNGITLYNVHIQGGGRKTIATKLVILTRLSFVNDGGVLSTGAGNATDFGVALLDGAQISGENENSYVLGNLTSTTSFPSGQAVNANFGNIGVELQTTYQGTPIAVTRLTGSSYSGVGTQAPYLSIQRSFTFSQLPSSSSVNFSLTFRYLNNELNGNTPTDLAIYTSPTGTTGFNLLGRTSLGTKSVTIQNANTTLASTFTLGGTSTPLPLPVTLVSFTATPTPQGAALLRWVTASETNNKGFGIERTLSTGDNWEEVGYVATANAANGKSYEYTDKSLITAPASTQAYYRLRQEDLDGTISYSPVAVVARQAVVANTNLVLSPVPVDGPNLSVSFAEAGQAGQEVAVINTQGQRMLHFTTQGSADGTLNLPVANLAAGVYIVRIQTPGQAVRHARFVKL